MRIKLASRVVAWAVLGLAGCPGPRAVPLETLSLHVPTALDAPPTRSRVVVTRFVDARGAEFGRRAVAGHIPLVGWFHDGITLHYPESSGALHGAEGVTVGGMDVALARLLADTLRRTQLAPEARSAVEASVLPPAAADAEFVVSGRLLRGRYREDAVPILGVALGLVGVPFRFGRFDLDLEVYLFRAGAPEAPLWSRAYHFRDSQAAGFYYHREMALPLLRHAFEHTLPEIARDLARVIAVAETSG